MVYTVSTRIQNSLDALRQSPELVNVGHPDYVYYKRDWDLIRDVLAGERRIKQFGEAYLPKAAGATLQEYEVYLDRAVFTNLTWRTLHGMVGTMFARSVEVTGMDKEHPYLESVDGGHTSLHNFAKGLATEVIALGRVGVLVDRIETGRPYLTSYTAEHIVAWATESRDGKEFFKYLLLREVYEDVSTDANGVLIYDNGDSLRAKPALRFRYRLLHLVDGVYEQRLLQFEVKGNTATMQEQTRVVPTRNGVPLNYIPFWIVGPLGVTAKMQRSPILDIATLNIAHYKASALLESGRYYTATPIYVVGVNRAEDQETEYVIGANKAWQIDAKSDAKILEYYGSGLLHLSNSLKEKEAAIEKIGGKLMGGANEAGAGQNIDVEQQKQANETATLLSVAQSVSTALTESVKFMMDWDNMPKANQIAVAINQDFKNVIGAREMRAVALLYERGLLPISQLFNVFKANNLIADGIDEKAFKGLLENMNEFPNNPDAQARSRGFADANAELLEKRAAEQRAHEMEIEKLKAKARSQNKNTGQQSSAEDISE